MARRRRTMTKMGHQMSFRPFEARLADIVAFAFTAIILIYAASGPISELVRWIVETTTEGFNDLSRRDQRNLLREHWLGGGFRDFERGFLQPTALKIGLPILLSFTIALLTLHKGQKFRWLNWVLTLAAIMCFTAWMSKIFVTDSGALPSAQTIDFVVLPVATAITLYLTWRMFGGFIVAFCLFWVLYFFVRGYLPEWTGILAGSESTIAQNLRAMVLNFWAQTGGMFGQPVQVVAGSVLIFIVFGAVMMSSGAGIF